ncbi:hypothetical protein HYPSUDRAFT_651642 [Hypholoma sublateritium FD-334 SS-4]|uniref:Uncharacterized protein n=1 Tax=Hypholoma sublateritium (strain FD-334 SS-4) TaxID=945553 RepID=A0A0D2NUH1_HYPSF|nr:hypothetical protein HYPSUDRAFT_651642 [Hypholoma sublateritium FD-334 SS-4]
MSITTPLTFPLAPGDDYDKAQTFATIASAFAYGMHIYSSKMRLSLSMYMLVMFGLSTLAIVQAILYNRRAIFCNSEGFQGTPFAVANTISDLTFSLNIPMLVPLTIWGADGFMLWRCLHLYRGQSGRPRIVLLSVLSVLCLISIGRL